MAHSINEEITELQVRPILYKINTCRNSYTCKPIAHSYGQQHVSKVSITQVED